MAKSRAVRILLWVLIVAAPFISILIIGLATGTSVFSIDAWSTSWNDEQRYYWTIRQMQIFGEPSGVAGYNEVMAPRPSYGPYIIFAYIPYYLGSFLTGIESHNFVYVINIAFGTIAAALIVLLLRPSVRESLCCIALITLHFIIARYVCSGMTEAIYVLFASIFACCTLYITKRESDPGQSTRGVVCAFVVMLFSIAFWGVMRPYLLAFVIVPCAMLVFNDYGLGKRRRIILFVLGVALALVAVVVYLYLTKYYATPYFRKQVIANSFFERVAKALPDLPGKHIESVIFSGAMLVKLRWQGIMVFTFALGWGFLLYLGISAKRRKDAPAATLLLALVIVGFVIFEAHMLLYTYKQMHRTMMAIDVVYLLAIIWMGGRNLGKSKITLRVVGVAAICLLCVGALAVRTGDFSLPQVKEGYSLEEEVAQHELFEKLMPRSENEWDNTIAHPVESYGIRTYFNIPIYMNLNSCQQDYLEDCLAKDSFKSKYVSIPTYYEFNKSMSAKYEVIYEDAGHILYRVRD